MAVLALTNVACLVLAVGLLSLLRTPRYWPRWTKGRVVTRPAARILRVPTPTVRFFTVLISTSLCVAGLAVAAASQVLACGVCQITGNLIYVVVFTDDLLTGGDEKRWKRWKSKARNAVRWRMKLPAPARPQPTA